MISRIDRYYTQQPEDAIPIINDPPPSPPASKEATQECIICQHQVPASTYEQHVMDCVDQEEMKTEQVGIVGLNSIY